MATANEFVWSELPEPHRSRTKSIINNHPDVRELIGRNPNTIWVICLCVGIQIGMSILIKDFPWWAGFVAAYVIGAFADHTLFICIHECAHNLLFKGKTANTLSGILANSVMVFPSSVSFQKYHLKHHAFQGVEELDADMPFRWEAKLIGSSTLGKALWLLFYPLFQLLRPIRLKNEIEIFDAWTLVNWVSNFTVTFLLIYFLGWTSGIYLVSSLFFSIGLHPLGARWVQEHFLTHGNEQETKSYYGPLNLLNLNVGYHNEHHDFPSVPWDKLPQIKSKAPEYYETLGYHTSYTALLFKFLFDKNMSVFSRVARKDRNKVGLNDRVNPDKDMLKVE
ncbi:MAG: fatty acid desaturase [Bacteroidota bacterium]|nr:fatty acid desaturase [Bacteroidota bacterium]